MGGGAVTGCGLEAYPRLNLLPTSQVQALSAQVTAQATQATAQATAQATQVRPPPSSGGACAGGLCHRATAPPTAS